MASWSDVPNIGNLQAGFLLDINFFNTYINALKEKANITTGSLHGNIDTIDDTQGFLLTFQFLKELLDSYGGFMKNITWIKKPRFDDPKSYTPIDGSTDQVWTQAEIETLITTPFYDILDNPYDSSLSYKDLLDADLWNAIYTLYKDVFIYYEQRHMNSSIVTWENYYIPTATGFQFSNTCPAGDRSCMNTYQNNFVTTYENASIILLSSGNGIQSFDTTFSGEMRQLETINGLPRDPANDDFTIGFCRTALSGAYTKRIHDSQNFDGDHVALGYSGQVRISPNTREDFIKKSGASSPRLKETLTQVSADFPYQANDGNNTLENYIWDNSAITGSGWELTGYSLTRPLYDARTTDMIYSLDDIAFIPTDTNGSQRENYITYNLSLYCGRNLTGSADDADMYYNSNVPAMNYYIAP